MFQRDVLLKDHCNYKIGGPADYFVVVKTMSELEAALKEWRKINPDGALFILGGGSNVLMSDAGFRGLVIKMEIDTPQREGSSMRVGAGATVQRFLEACADAGLSGFEWAGGLPGTIGGAVRGNAGAFGGETKDSVREVTSIPVHGGDVITRTNKECAFGYRMSIFKKNGDQEVIIEAVFDLIEGDPHAIRNVIQEKINYRTDRHPMEYPNIGSTFKNVPWDEVPEKFRSELEAVKKNDPFPVAPTAYLLAQSGVMGMTHGGAQISPKHPNFIVNLGNATAADVEALIAVMKEKVRARFDITLEEEIMRVGP